MGDEDTELRYLLSCSTQHGSLAQSEQERNRQQPAESPAVQQAAPSAAPQQPFVQSQQATAPQQPAGARIGYKVERLTDAELQTLGLETCRNEKLGRLLQTAVAREGLNVKRKEGPSLYKYYGRYTYSQDQQMHTSISEMLDLPEVAGGPMAFMVQFCIQFGKGLLNLEADPSASRKIAVYFRELNTVLRSRSLMTAQQALFQVTLRVNPLVFGYFRPGQESPAAVAKNIREVLDATNEDTSLIVRSHYLFNYLALREDGTLNFNTLISAVLEENLARVCDHRLQEQQRKDLAAQLFLQLEALMSMLRAEQNWLDGDSRNGYVPDPRLIGAAESTLAGLCKETGDNLASKRTQLDFFDTK